MHKIYLLVVISVTLRRGQNLNNVCSTIEDYFNHSSVNPNCWFDPEVSADHKRRAEINGFLLEEHTIRTDDGYILATFRLRKFSSSSGKEVIFLQHGLTTDSICFMSNKENSLAYFLARQGFDVWLGNYRGCENCSHETLAVNDPRYWDFSYHEHGLYDLSANFRYITEKTKRKIIFIGHSMGSTGMAVYASMKPNESKQCIKHAMLIAPSLYMRHTRGILEYIVKNVYELLDIIPLMNLYRVMTAGSFEKEAVSRFCFGSLENLNMCIQIIDITSGKSNYPVEPEKLPLLFSAIKAICLKNALHYAQAIHTGEFRMFDYGPKKNMARYHRRIPPNYNLSDISISLSLIYGRYDTLAAKEDVIYAFKTYGKPSWSLHETPHSHMDFLFSKVARKTILPLLIEIINKHVK